MSSVLENASYAVIWISIATSLLLGAFMVVQAWMDPPRRLRYLAFAATWIFLAAADAFSQRLGRPRYELLRLAWCGGYTGSLLWLLGWRPRASLLAALAFPLLGLAVWMGGFPDLATTATL